MKRGYLLILIILLLSAWGGVKAQWQWIGQPNFGANIAGNNALALDTAGVPYIAYITNDGIGVMSYSTSGNSWNIVGNSLNGFGNLGGCCAGTGYFSFLISPTTNYLYVVITDGSGINEGISVYYLPPGNTTWEYLPNSNLFAEPACGASLVSAAISDSGQIYVAYLADNLVNGSCDNYTSINVETYVNNNWQFVGPENWYPSADELTLAVDPNNGTPYVAFRDQNTTYLSVAQFNGTKWDTLGGIGFYQSQVDQIALAVNSGIPYVGFQDFTKGQGATVMKYSFSGTSWKYAGPEGSYGIPAVDSTDAASTINLAFDACNNLYVSWSQINEYELDEYNGHAWVNLSNVTFDNNWSNFLAGNSIPQCLAIDSKGNPMIAGGSVTASVAYYSNQAVPNSTYSVTGGEVTINPTSAAELNGATTWDYYSGVCGGTLAGSGLEPVSFSASAFPPPYYVRGAGTCVEPGCVEVITAGIPEIEKASLKIYPNPGNDYLTISNTYQPFKNITITDLAGRVIHNSPCDGLSVNLNTTDLSAGSYLVKITNADNSSIVNKIEVVH